MAITKRSKPMLYDGQPTTFPTFVSQILRNDGTPLFKDGKSMIDGLVYPITALELETMSQEEQAELYAQGYRLIVADYNDTVTAHYLAADGSLSWIGDKPRNLADNPNFSDPINQREVVSGQTITSWDYFVDRWRIRADSGTINFLDNAIETSATIGQPLDPEIFKTGEIVTVAAEWTDGTICVVTGTISRSNVYTQFSSEMVNGHNVYVSDEGNGVDVVFNISAGIVKWAALYKGSYTTKTLPPWVAPDPAAELLKCQRYYYPSKFNQYQTIGLGYEAPAYAFLVVGLPSPMRTDAPTLTQSASIKLGARSYMFNSCAVNGSQAIIGVNYTAIQDPAGGIYGYAESPEGVTLEFCNDL